MTLAIEPPFPPMEAELVGEIPGGSGWQYEPKWDGFRALVFRDGDRVQIQSKAGQPLERYFPELVEAIQILRARQFVLDGEIVVPAGGKLSFDDLLQRIHPARSRIEKLAREHPASLIAFDLLLEPDGGLLSALPLAERRARLEEFAKKYFPRKGTIHLSPATPRLDQARKWFEEVGADLDGIVAKRVDLAYLSGERSGMRKIKKLRSADCVVGGFRFAAHSRAVGSLLLGLYGKDGLLHHVGFTSAFRQEERKKLLEKVEPLVEAPGFTGRAPGGPSRWNPKGSGQWEPLKPALVAEVEYDHFTGGRFRHGTKLLRWRPDKTPEECKLSQVERESSASPLVLL